MNYWEKVFKNNGGYYNDLDATSRLEILGYIQPSDSVLDIGCGGGALKAILPPKQKYLGIDYSETAIKLACERHPDARFMVADSRNMRKIFKDNEYDVVVMRHFLENQEDWKAVVKEAFRICDKRVIIVCRRPFVDGPTRLLENPDDTWVWDMNFGEFNLMARELTVNVSYGKVADDEFVILGKHLDNAVFDADDWHDTNHNLPLLLSLKERFPALKCTLFCIPSKCSAKFINSVKERYGNWLQFQPHGFYHDINGLTAQECNFWTYEEANGYLDKIEDMGCFGKIFRPPGWNINWETEKALSERGYILANHKDHDTWLDYPMPRYKTGHLMEVHSHIQNCNMNGLEEIASTKCNFGLNTKFHFIDEPGVISQENYLPNSY